MKNKIKNIIILITIILTIFGFIFIADINYKKHIEIRNSVIEHPSFLPKKELLKYTSFWFSNLRADIYWLETIQYIWWNAIWSEYKKYLYNILDITTYLNPYFEHPYIIWELLLPWYNKRYENLSIEEQNQNNNQAITIWLKWIDNFCDMEKINLIENEFEINKLWTEEKYKNPCKSYVIPYYLAYVYFYHTKDLLEASKYYKIASANTDSVTGTRLMAAIMQWKWWNREKSILMFLNLAKWMEWNEICSSFSSELEKVYIQILDKKIDINWSLVKNIEDIRNNLFWINLDEVILNKTDCWSYLLKATREINLHYLEEANEKYKKDNWDNATNGKELYDSWYIDFLPTDYQQNDDYWIRYIYNNDSGNFDYEMNYGE